MFYSGRLPGVISGEYSLEECQIDLRLLARRAQVAFIVAEIKALNISEKSLFLENRPTIHFSHLSLDVGAQLPKDHESLVVKKHGCLVPIKPFDQAVKWIKSHDDYIFHDQKKSFSVIGSGLAGLEIVLALRKRWPKRTLNLHVQSNHIHQKLQKILKAQQVNLVIGKSSIENPALLCTGGLPPRWLKSSGLPVDSIGRVITCKTLQVIGHSFIFAVGDCGVIQKFARPSAGVWAVRAARPLAKNLERCSKGLKPIPWRPQRFALQLVGGPFLLKSSFALAFFGKLIIGPYEVLWKWKHFLDKRFIKMFDGSLAMKANKNKRDQMDACRGCASKVSAKTLKGALKQSNLLKLSEHAEDAATLFTLPNGECFLQSVDGFPALVSDPWLNARLTTLHACSDVWASGAKVLSVQPVITLPPVSSKLQQDLLIQILGGVQSALAPQSASIIGGHTLESRGEIPSLITMGVEISLTVNGQTLDNSAKWTKEGLEPGDVLLLSRNIGSGVLFAAFMNGYLPSSDMDLAISQMSLSQHSIVESLLSTQLKNNHSSCVHACTDITGFGLLGHLGEMLTSSNSTRIKSGLAPLKITLEVERIPVFQGALDLFDRGFESTLAPANRSFWNMLEPTSDYPALVELNLGKIKSDSCAHHNIMEILVDPQTCGPLALACSANVAKDLVEDGSWHQIGSVGFL